jgi:hypothetical protein
VWVPFTLPVFQSKVAVTEKPLLTGGVSISASGVGLVSR